MAFLALVIAVWELARIPIEGSYSLSLAHARDWLSLEHTLHLDIEASLIRCAHDANAEEVLRWGYYNFHLPVLFALHGAGTAAAPRALPVPPLGVRALAHPGDHR